jgi:hypothetical protein
MGERIQQGAGVARSFSLLEQPTQTTPNSLILSPLQEKVDGMVGGFLREATRLSTLSAMVGGGLSYRLGRAGALSSGIVREALGPLSVVVGLGAEVTSFEMIHRSLLHLSGEGRQNPNLFRWNGEGGLGQGLLTSLITFGSLKGAGRLAQGENMVLQHLVQDSAMVLAHQASGSLGWTPQPSGNLAEQFLQAEATNLQLGGGTSLVHGLAPGIHGIERALDLSFPRPGPEAPLFARWAFEGVSDVQVPSSNRPGLLKMEKLLDGVGGGEPPEKKDPPLLTSLKKILGEDSGREMVLRILLQSLEGVGDAHPDLKQEVLTAIRRDFQITMDEGQGVPIETYYFAMKRILFIAEHYALYAKYGLKGLLERNVLGLYDPRFNLLPQLENTFWYPSGKKGNEPPPVSYSPQAEDWLGALEPQLKRAHEEWPRLNSREEALSRRVDENLVAKVWNYQLLHFAEQVGAVVSVKDAECLVDSFHPEAPSLEGDVLSKALNGMKDLDPETRQVFELSIPYLDVVFGKKNEADAIRASIPHLLRSFQYSLEGAVRLVHETPRGSLVLRIPSPSLLERLLEAVHGDQAPRFYYLDGEVPRDEMMRAREMGMALIGFVRNPVILGDVDALVHPWAFPFHDIFHAHAVSRYDAPIRRFAASLYRFALAHASDLSPFLEAHLNRLVDFDQGPSTYLKYTLKDLLEESGAPWEVRIDFVRRYRELLGGFQTSDSLQAFFLGQFHRELHSVEGKLNRKRKIVSLLKLFSLR